MSRPAIRERYASHEPVAKSKVILAVGDVLSLRSRSEADIAGDATAFANFADVTQELVDALDPQIVVSSVLGRNFDCVDLAERLDHLGFRGRYCLIAHGIPEPGLVLREIRSLFPALQVELDPTAGY